MFLENILILILIFFSFQTFDQKFLLTRRSCTNLEPILLGFTSGKKTDRVTLLVETSVCPSPVISPLSSVSISRVKH